MPPWEARSRPPWGPMPQHPAASCPEGRPPAPCVAGRGPASAMGHVSRVKCPGHVRDRRADSGPQGWLAENPAPRTEMRDAAPWGPACAHLPCSQGGAARKRLQALACAAPSSWTRATNGNQQTAALGGGRHCAGPSSHGRRGSLGLHAPREAGLAPRDEGAPLAPDAAPPPGPRPQRVGGGCPLWPSRS